MQTLYLNFPVFYQIVVKGNTGFRQSETVNILLLGKPRSERNERELSPSVVSNYVIGRKRLSADLLFAVTSCTDFELERRFRRLGLHNLDTIITVLTNILGRFSNISSAACTSLLQEAQNKDRPLTFLIHLFRIALTCPANEYRTLTKADLALITSFFPAGTKKEIPLPQYPSDTQTMPDGLSDSTDQLIFKLGKQHDKPLTRHEQKELDIFRSSIQTTQMKLRPLNLPNDITPAINYLFETGAGEVLPAAKRDLKTVLSSLDEKSTAMIIEYCGSSRQILFACHSVPYLQNCLYLLALIEENTSIEFSDIEEITSALEMQCPYDADIQTAVYHNEKQTVPLKVRLLYIVM